ncbi:unnamed protein product [marine sediment metagenome]|uniref:Uncharacterized protein n=1 Tax=marine sediment metagenome TaxID=412755 RepID=X0WAI3_9ZZZZ
MGGIMFVVYVLYPYLPHIKYKKWHYENPIYREIKQYVYTIR